MTTTSALTDDTMYQSDDRLSVILINIKELQAEETALYTELENASAASDTAEQEALVIKINDLSTMRMTLFSELDALFQDSHDEVSKSRIDLVDQLTTAGVMETELNNTKSNLNYLTDNKNNKMRMVGINTYYASMYQAQSGLMKLIIIVCIPLLILAILAKKKILPQNIANVFIGIILVIGGFMIIKQSINLASRSNMNYDEFNWKWWDPGDADTSDTTTSSSLTLGSGCVGSACCSSGMYYDSDLGQCQSGSVEEGFSTGRSRVSYVEVPATPCPFKQNKTVVKPYSEETYNFVKVSTR